MKHPSAKIMKHLIRYTIQNSGKNFQPTGCFIVKGNKVVSRGVSSTMKDNDITAHAELNAMRMLSRKRKNIDMNGYWVYTTQIPCPMCASAMAWSEADGLVYGWNGKNGWINEYFGDMNAIKLIFPKIRRKKIKVFGPFLQKNCMKINGYGKKPA
jgi:tRNA(Arg) A34 adenosine deaminase TadA